MSAKKKYDEIDQQTFDDGDKNKKKVVINSLDYDSLAQIISLLPIPEMILMEEVCTKWKEASQLAWYDIKKYKCESSIRRNCYDVRLLTQSYLEKILLKCGNYLKDLSLSDVCNSTIMPFVGDHCKNLTSLECKFPGNTVNNNADDFVQAFTQLHKLKCIKIIMINDKSLDDTLDLFGIINSLPEEIYEIHMISEDWVSKEKKVSLTFKKFKNLQQLTLHGCRFLDSIVLQEIAEKTTLVHLDIRLYEIPERFFLFDKLVNLEYINLTLVTYPSPYFCGEKNNISTKVLNTIFCTCKNLKHLEMPPALYDIAEIPLKKWINFQNLEYLGISCNNIMPDLANTIVEYCKNLKYLRIHNRDRLMNETALKKLTELENLECLILLLCIILSEESIIAISNNCKKLRVLEIPNCYLVPSIDGKLSSPSVFKELSKLRYLEHLNLNNMYPGKGTDLEDSTIIAIANNCKNLNILHIRNHMAITETALVALTNLENLQQLCVESLNNITDDFIIKLKGFKSLNCSYCQKLTIAGLIQFIKNNPDLEQMAAVEMRNIITTDLVIAADQATKNRTNGIILHFTTGDYWSDKKSFTRPIIQSQWLIVKYIFDF